VRLYETVQDTPRAGFMTTTKEKNENIVSCDADKSKLRCEMNEF
jgi:hypothetical protein